MIVMIESQAKPGPGQHKATRHSRSTVHATSESHIVQIMTYTCLHCHKSFDGRKGLTVHQGKCPKRGRVRLRGPYTGTSFVHACQCVQPDSVALHTVQTSSDPSTSHTQAETGPNLPILRVDSLRAGMDSGLTSYPATPGASTDDGPIHSPHRHLTTDVSTGGPSLPEPSLEPEADTAMSLNLSRLGDPSSVNQPQSLVDHLPSEPTGLRRSTRSRIMTSRMRESISQQPSRKRRRTGGPPTIRSPGTASASPSWADGADQPTASTDDEPVTDSEQQILIQEDRLIETEEDAMGLFRRYTVLPSTDPDQYLTIHHVSDAPTFIQDTDSQYNPLTVFGPQAMQNIGSPTSVTTPSSTPFLNHSVSKLMNWFYQSSTKTLADLNSLVHDVILHPDFHSSDLENFSATRESRRLEKSRLPDSDLPYLKNDDWMEAVIKVPLPFVRTRYHNEDDAHTLEVKFVHRRLCEVIKSGIQDFASSRNFHWRGFKQFWRPSDSEPEQRVYGEVYTSDAFLEMESRLPDIEGCTLEKAIVPLLIYSDSTHLASFGTASLWPIYIWFGNVSKYIRLRATSFSAHHLAYLPSVSNS